MESNKRQRLDGDADVILMKEQYQYSLKQYALRAVERYEKDHQTLKSAFDRLLVNWLLYYERRDERCVQIIINSEIRVPWVNVAKMLGEVESSAVDDVVKEVDDLLTALGGAEEAMATEEMTPAVKEDVEEELESSSQFWKFAKEYLLALQCSRDSPTLEGEVEKRMLELVEKSKRSIDQLVAQLQAVVIAAEADRKLGTTAAAPTACVDLAFFRSALAAANVMRWMTALETFHFNFYLGEDTLPPPPTALSAEEERKLQAVDHTMTTAESVALMRKEGNTLGEGEDVFTEELLMLGKSNDLAEKVSRPAQPTSATPGAPEKKKPRRYAKVQHRYHWNKYNRAHYDHKTPPPRVVTGYEFNLWYPDAVTMKKTPTYYIKPTEKGEDDDHCLLVFHCDGGVYEDVVYRIANKRWDQRRGGRRCTFDSYGKLRLYFRFEFQGYRR